MVKGRNSARGNVWTLKTIICAFGTSTNRFIALSASPLHTLGVSRRHASVVVHAGLLMDQSRDIYDDEQLRGCF